MEILTEFNKITISGAVDFDIEKTLECGQVFRFKKLANNDYILYSLDKSCHIYLQNEQVIIDTGDTDYFYNYFDLRTDYSAIYSKLKNFDELSVPLNLGRGIRILRQDVFETIVSFIISANNNIPRIKGIIERLCGKFGKAMNGYNAFVAKDDFFNMTREDFASIGAGFRADYLYADRVILNDGAFYEKLKAAETKECESLLLSLKGVGPKVASCILLFGLSKTDSYPVDTWIFKANKSEELDTPQKVQAYYLDRYQELAGYAQQYVFYSKRNLKQ